MDWYLCACGAEHDTPACPFGWVHEAAPFPAFLATLNPLELAALQHGGDAVTLEAVLAEFKRREAARREAAQAGERDA